MAEHSLLLPFLNQDPVYTYGCELGLSVLAPMFRKRTVVKGYFRTENEEHIRLACHRLGYDLVRCKAWVCDGEETGWVWMKMRRRPEPGLTPPEQRA